MASEIVGKNAFDDQQTGFDPAPAPRQAPVREVGGRCCESPPEPFPKKIRNNNGIKSLDAPKA